MSGEPGNVKVRQAIYAALQTITGITWIYARSDDEPITQEERPAGILRIVETSIDIPQGRGEAQHSLAWEIDVYSSEASFNDSSDELEIIKSQINAALAADRTLGGLVPEIFITGSTAAPEAVPDVGVMTITGQTTFFTSEDDFNTVMGANGPIA